MTTYTNYCHLRSQSGRAFGRENALFHFRELNFKRSKGRSSMQSLLKNFRYSVRMLRKNPGLTMAVIVTLALGIGATTAIYTVVYSTLLAPLPLPHPEQLVMVWSKIGGGRNGMSAGDFLDWQRQNKTFQGLCAVTSGNFNLTGKDQPEQVDGNRTTPGYYNMMGFPIMMGRDFLPEEGIPGGDHVVILTHKLWDRLGANKNCRGQSAIEPAHSGRHLGGHHALRAPVRLCSRLVRLACRPGRSHQGGGTIRWQRLAQQTSPHPGDRRVCNGAVLAGWRGACLA